jgi:predicted dehydrogenase
MADQIRVGIVGSSWFADMLHLPNLKSHPDAHLSAICGRNRERAEEMAGKYGFDKVFTDYRALIDSGTVEALVVVAPDDLHYEITMEALEAGLHVLCEKPLALSGTHAKSMHDKAAATGVKHMTFFTYRWLPQYRYVKRLIDEGYIGRCYHFNCRYLGGYGRDSEYGWRFDGQRSNGILGDLGSHMIDLAHWWVGNIAQVSGRIGTYVERPGPEGQPLDPANDAATMSLGFANGAQGVIHVSAVADMGERGQEQHFVLYGESGTLEITMNYSQGVRIRGIQQGDDQFTDISVPDDLYGDVDRAEPFISQSLAWFQSQPIGDRLFIDSILEDRAATPDFLDGWKAQVVVDATMESHRTGSAVQLS